MGRIRNARDKLTRHRAKALRGEDTPAEARLWNALRAGRLGGWKWKRQVPFGPYILDFLCHEAALVVEVDGGQHSTQIVYDARRTAYLERAGLHVLRFWNAAVLTNRGGVCLTILNACNPHLLSPARAARREGEGRERADS